MIQPVGIPLRARPLFLSGPWSTHPSPTKPADRFHSEAALGLPTPPPATYPRVLSQRERSQFQEWFPQLDVQAARVSAPATPRYNCIAWSSGNRESWDWPPSMYEGTPEECFQQYYQERGFVALTRPPQEGEVVVATWGNAQGPTHGSVAGPNHGERWESKCGAAARILHGRDELESELYGTIQHYWLKSKEVSVEPLSTHFKSQQRLEHKLALRLAGLDPQLTSAFQEGYSRWKADCQKPSIALSSNPQHYLEGEGYQSLLALGPEALPLWLDKLNSGDFFCHYAVQKLTQKPPHTYQLTGPDPQPALKAETRGASEQDKGQQVLLQWLNSQW